MTAVQFLSQSPFHRIKERNYFIHSKMLLVLILPGPTLTLVYNRLAQTQFYGPSISASTILHI